MPHNTSLSRDSSPRMQRAGYCKCKKQSLLSPSTPEIDQTIFQWPVIIVSVVCVSVCKRLFGGSVCARMCLACARACVSLCVCVCLCLTDRDLLHCSLCVLQPSTTSTATGPYHHSPRDCRWLRLVGDPYEEREEEVGGWGRGEGKQGRMASRQCSIISPPSPATQLGSEKYIQNKMKGERERIEEEEGV